MSFIKPITTCDLSVLNHTLESLYAGTLGCLDAGMPLSAYSCQLLSNPCITLGPFYPLRPFIANYLSKPDGNASVLGVTHISTWVL